MDVLNANHVRYQIPRYPVRYYIPSWKSLERTQEFMHSLLIINYYMGKKIWIQKEKGDELSSISPVWIDVILFLL